MIQNNKTHNRKLVDGITRKQSVVHAQPKMTIISKQIAYSGLRLVGVFAVLILVILRVSVIGNTISYYRDTETSTENTLKAGNLSLVLSSTEDALGRIALLDTRDTPPVEEENIGSEQFSIDISSGDESLPMIYEVFGEPDPGNGTGCEKLLFDANLGSYNYNGLFNGFNSGVMSETGEWIMMVHFPVDDPELSSDLVCKGDIVFRAGLGGVDSDLTHTYSDEKRYSFELKNWESSAVTSFGVQSESLVSEESPPLEENIPSVEDPEQETLGDQNPPILEENVTPEELPVEETTTPPLSLPENEII